MKSSGKWRLSLVSIAEAVPLVPTVPPDFVSSVLESCRILLRIRFIALNRSSQLEAYMFPLFLPLRLLDASCKKN